VRLFESSSNFEVGISKLLSQIATGKIPFVSEMNFDSTRDSTARSAGRFIHPFKVERFERVVASASAYPESKD
jgi:hypothetical protein